MEVKERREMREVTPAVRIRRDQKWSEGEGEKVIYVCVGACASLQAKGSSLPIFRFLTDF